MPYPPLALRPRSARSSPRLRWATPALAVLLAGCASVTEVERVTAETKLGQGGVTYSLPVTHVRVAVPLEQKVHSVTRAATLCELLLGVEPLRRFKIVPPADLKKPQKAVVALSVQEGTAISTVGQADPEQTFLARFKGGPFQDTNATFKLNSKGVMSKGTSETDNKTIDFAVATIEAVAKVAAKVIKPASFAPPQKAFNSRQLTLIEHAAKAYELPPEVLALGLRVERLPDTDREQAIEKLEQAHDPTWEKWKADGAEVRKEIKAAQALAALSEARAGAFAGLEPTPDAETMKLKLAELDAKIGKLTDHFAGEEKKTPWTANFDYRPESLPGGPKKTSTKDVTLLTLGTVQGEGDEETPVLWLSDLLLDLPAFAVAARPTGTPLLLTLRTQPLPAAPLAAKLSEEPGRHGFPYRIPADATAAVSFKGKPLSRQELRVAQQGIVAYLPRSLGSKKLKIDLDLDESTGAMTGLTTTSTAFDPALIGRVGAAAGEVIDAEKLRVKAEEAKNDPIAQLTRRKTLLQLKKDIRALEEEAGAD
jgi:hypothetical protein